MKSIIETKEDKTTIYILVDDNNTIQGWSTTKGSIRIDSQECREVEIELYSCDPFFNTPFNFYKYINGKLIKDEEYILNLEKAKKREELNIACKESILKGFNYTFNGVEYHFSYDEEAQINFSDAKQVLNDGAISEIPWTVHTMDGKYARINITKSMMSELTLAIVMHKNNNISKYRDELLPLVEKAKTVEEVRAIKW
jgi:hypothetical protein